MPYTKAQRKAHNAERYLDADFRKGQLARARINRLLPKNYIKDMLLRAKNRSKIKGLDFAIDVSDVVIPDVCPILGILLVKGSGGRPTNNSPSLDRRDPSKGYIKGNVWVISNRANTIKNDGTAEEHYKIYLSML